MYPTTPLIRTEDDLDKEVAKLFEDMGDIHKGDRKDHTFVYGGLLAKILSLCRLYMENTGKEESELARLNKKFYRKIIKYLLDKACDVSGGESDALSQLESLAQGTVLFRRHARSFPIKQLNRSTKNYEKKPQLSELYCRLAISEYVQEWDSDYNYLEPQRIVDVLIKQGQECGERLMHKSLFKFSLLHRFFAYCHLHDPDRAFHFRIANAALMCSLDSYQILRAQELVLPITTLIVRQGAEWIINAGEDLATACLCEAKRADIDKIFFDYDPSSEHYDDILDYRFGLIGHQYDNYTFNVQRWENWKKTLTVTIEHHETEIEMLEHNLSKLGKDEPDDLLKSDLRRIKPTLGQCLKALHVMYELDRKMERIDTIVKGVRNEIDEDAARQKIKEEYGPVAEPLPVNLERDHVFINAKDMEWRSRARFVWAAVNYSFKNLHTSEELVLCLNTDLADHLMEDISTISKEAPNPEGTFKCFKHLNQSDANSKQIAGPSLGIGNTGLEALNMAVMEESSMIWDFSPDRAPVGTPPTQPRSESSISEES
ncbi:hypothetical protein HD806DRAFT_523318 [Xylariaceae sp. AK1471]|nr:hypothetical protein HD806DRAFT_523318 [Xylariaceae sp. AK1471]